MLKRTKIYLLLTLLVLTGFAGSLNNESLTAKERKVLVNDLKDTKKAFLQSIKGLSDAQLDYRANDTSWSIRDCIYHIAATETSLWKMADNLMKQPANPEKKKIITITDEQRMQMMRDRSTKYKTRETLDPRNQSLFSNTEAALDSFRENRAALIKFAKTTTDDLRSHVSEGFLGPVDAYQVLLLISGHTARHTQQIEEVKNSAGFPK